jgi:hypothetical protein
VGKEKLSSSEKICPTPWDHKEGPTQISQNKLADYAFFSLGSKVS